MSIKSQYSGFLNSSLLWENNSLFGLTQFDLPYSEVMVSDITSISIPKNEVLGKRIEHFFEYLINTSGAYQIILKNKQIFKNKITIGELDFLLEDIQQKQIIHIELVYKFYLYNPEKSDIELERWIGPNRTDSLLEKITKLKTKQLPLLYRPESIVALNEIGVNIKNIKQQICFFGNLFIPIALKNKSFPKLNNHCIVGFWIALKDFTSEKYGSNVYYIPQKKDWIAKPKHHRDWYTYDAIQEPLNIQLSKKRSPLLWIKSKGDFFSKCFVVWW